MALKVGALSFGGGFVIIPLMQADAVHHYHWMTNAQFLNGVALGQITPGSGRPDGGRRGLRRRRRRRRAAGRRVAFAPSFVFVLPGPATSPPCAPTRVAQSFLAGAGPAAIGAIAGAAVTLSLALTHLWQLAVLAAPWCIVGLRRSVVLTLVGAGAVGAVGAALGLPVG